MAEPNLHPPDFSSFLDQTQSPLFSIVPPEIRGEIFAFALADFEDTEKAYNEHTYWARPGYHAPRRSCTELLRTCKRVYAEAWHLPFAFSEHAFYLCHSDRAPRGSLTTAKFQACLDTVHRFHPKVETGHLRIFPQLWKLEQTLGFQNILDMRHFYPKSVTVTIRYTDWWYWEDNSPLEIDAFWMNGIRLPNSVTRFSMDFETIERRKGEIEYIASEAADKWHFKRMDGVVLAPRKLETSAAKWTGSSILGGRRWTRDETRQNELDYHVVTVNWRPSGESSLQNLPKSCPKLKIPEDFQRPYVSDNEDPYIWIDGEGYDFDDISSDDEDTLSDYMYSDREEESEGADTDLQAQN